MLMASVTLYAARSQKQGCSYSGQKSTMCHGKKSPLLESGSCVCQFAMSAKLVLIMAQMHLCLSAALQLVSTPWAASPFAGVAETGHEPESLCNSLQACSTVIQKHSASC